MAIEIVNWHDPDEALDAAVRDEIARMTSSQLATFALDTNAPHNTPSFCALVDQLVGRLLRDALSRRSYDPDVADFECALAEVIEARFVAQVEEQR